MALLLALSFPVRQTKTYFLRHPKGKSRESIRGRELWHQHFTRRSGLAAGGNARRLPPRPRWLLAACPRFRKVSWSQPPPQALCREPSRPPSTLAPRYGRAAQRDGGENCSNGRSRVYWLRMKRGITTSCCSRAAIPFSSVFNMSQVHVSSSRPDDPSIGYTCDAGYTLPWMT